MYKNEDFLLFTIVYSKINMNIAKTISPRKLFAEPDLRKYKSPSAKALVIAECQCKFQRLNMAFLSPAVNLSFCPFIAITIISFLGSISFVSRSFPM